MSAEAVPAVMGHVVVPRDALALVLELAYVPEADAAGIVARDIVRTRLESHDTAAWYDERGRLHQDCGD